MFVFFKSEGEEEREAPSPFLPAEVRDLLRRQLQREAAGTALRGRCSLGRWAAPQLQLSAAEGGREREEEEEGGRRPERRGRVGEGRGGEANRRSLKAPPPLPVGETEATLSLPPPSSASPLPGSSVRRGRWGWPFPGGKGEGG